MERLKIWVYVLLFAALILVNNSTVEVVGVFHEINFGPGMTRFTGGCSSCP